MNEPRPPLIAQFAVLAAAVFVGGAGAALVQSAVAPVEAETFATPAAAAPAGPELAAALADLARELRALRETPPSTPAPAAESSVRVPAMDAGANWDELTNVLRELLAEFAQQRGAALAPRASHLTRSAQERTWLTGAPPGCEDVDAFYTRQHLFWNEQQVLDRFGLPDSVYVSDKGILTWEYDDSELEGERSFEVQFYAGRVIAVEE